MGFFIVVLTEVQNGDKWPSLTHVTIGEPQRLGEMSSGLSANFEMCKDLVTVNTFTWWWNFDLDFWASCHFLRPGWAGLSDFSRRNVWQRIQGWNISDCMSGDDLQFHHLEQRECNIIHSSIRPNATISITNIL